MPELVPTELTLLPCPFCGSHAAICCWETESEFWVECSCGVETTTRRTETEAVKFWNRRAATVVQASQVPDDRRDMALALRARNAAIEECARITSAPFGLAYTAQRNKEVAKEVADQIGVAIQALAARQVVAPAEKAYAAALENLKEAWAALAMIREAVETLAPSGSAKAAEHLVGPTFMHEAEALVAGIMAIAAQPRFFADNGDAEQARRERRLKDGQQRPSQNNPDGYPDETRTQPQTSGVWQPYVTAPRDGTTILCYWGPSVPGGERAIDIACWIDGNWCDADDADTHFGEPDLWKPLDWPPLPRPNPSGDVA